MNLSSRRVLRTISVRSIFGSGTMPGALALWRQRPNDFNGYAVARPAGGFLFDQAQRQHISYFNYGEAFAGLSAMPDRNRSAALLKEEKRVAAQSDFGPDITPGG